MRSLQDGFGLTYVVISHDLSLMKYLATGSASCTSALVELGTSDEVYSAPRHPYTAGSSRPSRFPIGAASREIRRWPGRRAALSPDPPSGCHFRTRCPLATDRCTAEAPRLLEAPAPRRGLPPPTNR